MMSSESMQKTGLQFPRKDPLAASTIHEQIESKILDEVVHVVTKTLPIKGVKHRMAGSIGDGASSFSLSTFAEFQRLTAESALIDLAVFRTTKGTAYEFHNFALLNIV